MSTSLMPEHNKSARFPFLMSETIASTERFIFVLGSAKKVYGVLEPILFACCLEKSALMEKL